MKNINFYTILFFSFLLVACSTSDTTEANTDSITKSTIKYLALGDSYTVGNSVCSSCKFPEQLKDSIQKDLDSNTIISLQIIAKTGWTTSNLIAAINEENPSADFDLVTLLIGVNNQYQNKPFALYEQEFLELVNKAISLAKGEKSNVIVVSIPDYAFTPYGYGNQTISAQIQKYNTFAKNYCEANEIEFVNITDITQEGLINPNLVALDGLHPSELAYTKFVERILPKAKEALK